MSSKLFIGNLSWNTNTESLREAFSRFGQVTDAIVMTDRETGRSRGFGFVTFSDESAAAKAVEAMNDQDMDGRRIRAQFANAREGGSAPRSGGFSRGGNEGGYGASSGGW